MGGVEGKGNPEKTKESVQDEEYGERRYLRLLTNEVAASGILTIVRNLSLESGRLVNASGRRHIVTKWS
jgi:hypothetical protein